MSFTIDRRIAKPSTVRNPHLHPAINIHPSAEEEVHLGAKEGVMEESFDIEYFEVNNNEINISKSVPKLKGQSNFRDWEAALYLALTVNNSYYTHMISTGIPMPTPPAYADTTSKSVRQGLVKEARDAAGDETVDITITSAEVRARVKGLVELNEALRKKHNAKCNKWRSCNNRACIQLRMTLGPQAMSLVSQITDVHEAFKKLRKTYAASSHQQSYARYTKWVDLRFKNGTATNFVRKFQEALRDLNETAGVVVPPVIVLCQFKKAVTENARCHAFLRNLKVNEKDDALMDNVYIEFVDAETTNRSINPSYLASY
ncbi:hypothetical protein N7516_004063 [Penicillium verrucosum]|uniref:uncharacterized protein n=1 Tax=Penicillium verrucosum TaxID=60171 RepID=UPI0025455757|nr:uncharacterized protein N7516_004063 [Penicillium verrucosum]KAJ5943895.1 hypothetical protein N7516_004063 [Penicillium verrucosum]